MAMKNIVAIAGSNHKDSRTERLVNLWLKRMAELDDTIRYEVFCLRDFKVNMCEGCDLCFYNGICTMDKKDDTPFLREKMLESDVIVFACPVYMLNLSGIMKNFIDRLAYYSHTLNLSGKLGFTVTTTLSGGGELVSDLLQQLQIFMGTKNVNNFVFKASYDDEMAAVETWAKVSLEDLSHPPKWNDRRLETQFLSLKNHYSIKEIDDTRFWSEIRFWQQPAVQQCSSFQEFAANYKQFQKPSIENI